MWDSFRGKEDTNFIVADKANALAPILYALSLQLVKTYQDIEKASREDSETKEEVEQSFYMVLETLIFFLHVVDRVASSCLPRAKYEVFIDYLILRARERFVGGVAQNKEDEKSFRDIFTKCFNGRQVEYARYKKYIAAEGENKSESLLWEYAKNMGGYFKDSFLRTWIVTQAEVLAGIYIEEMKLEELFSSKLS